LPFWRRLTADRDSSHSGRRFGTLNSSTRSSLLREQLSSAKLGRSGNRPRRAPDFSAASSRAMPVD
jgi:hypothetical protein